VCHWTRSVRSRAESAHQVDPDVEADVRIDAESFTGFPAARAAQPPLRSPPSSPLFA
jgi:hypothetical protein